MNAKRSFLAGLVLLASATFATGVQANVIYDISLDFSAVTGTSLGLYFQLTDGSGTGDANNAATISNFNLSGGTAGACPAFCDIVGGVTGDVNAGTVQLTDSGPALNSILQQLTAGSALSFRVELTTNVDLGGTPDAFSFQIWNPNSVPADSLPTMDPSGANSFLLFNIDSSDPQPSVWSTDPNASVYSISIQTPQQVTNPPPPAAPEPASLLLVGTGLMLLLRGKRRRRG